jgi:predicted O-linked N-acetylglucosamine transferase (SPINDLY family)
MKAKFVRKIKLGGTAYSPEQAFKIATEQYHQGQLEDARKIITRLVKAIGRAPEILHLGALVEAGFTRFVKAEKLMREVLKSSPGDAKAWNNLGNILESQAKLEEAVAAFRNAIRLAPDNALSYSNLAGVLSALGRMFEANTAYTKSIAIDPDSLDALTDYGNLLSKLLRYAEAIEIYEHAVSICPDDPYLLHNLAIAYAKNDQLDKAIQFFDRAYAADSNFAFALWKRSLSLPITYTTEQEIYHWRKKWEHGIDTLIAARKEKPRAFQESLFETIQKDTNFPLPYQGLDLTDLQRKYGQLVYDIVGDAVGSDFQQSFQKHHGGKKIRVGFLSSFFRSHTVFHLFKGWIFGLDQEKFDVYCVDIGKNVDGETKTLSQNTHYVHIRNQTIRDQVTKIRNIKLDVLIFLEIGMEPLNQVLASFRLATVQCGTWGHPVTSGIPSVDFFLSADLMEPETGQNFYSESLVRLPNISISFQMPSTPYPAASDLEMDKKNTSYLCTQSLFKLLPQDDHIFAEIALINPNSRFVFLKLESEVTNALFWDRLIAAFQNVGLDAAKYCRIQSRVTPMEFHALNQRADVILDSTNWSGGHTSLIALGLDRPVVTLPGPFMRGRHTFGMLKRMGIDDLIAKNKQDYSAIAAELGMNSAFYRKVQSQLQDRKRLLFDDAESIAGLQNFIESRI